VPGVSFIARVVHTAADRHPGEGRYDEGKGESLREFRMRTARVRLARRRNHEDFRRFAIEGSPGYTRTGEPQFLFKQTGFYPIAPGAKPKPSNLAPIQKFNWWDGGINEVVQGKTFKHTVTPVRGTGADDLHLQKDGAQSASVEVPKALQGKIATYFNRAVVSAQSFLKLKNAELKRQMEWRANGPQKAIPEVLNESDSFDCAIYHLSDKLWAIPAFEDFKGRGSITYFDKGSDSKSCTAAQLCRFGRNLR
jgi:hypothetical protein